MRKSIFLLAALLVLLTGCQPYQYHGLLLNSPMAASDVTLTDQPANRPA